ncbi:hypothetical protein WA158_004805 [Blastocystis sp. Blastoise]
MSGVENLKTEDKYLFTFQDETQLWISKEFIEKYHQFPFHDIIGHSEKYDDGSYYIDMLPFHMEKVIQFLMEDNIDIFSLNLKDSYDIYETLVEYSVTIDNIIQSDLLFHVKELFFNYLKENNYNISQSSGVSIIMPMELFNSDKKKLAIEDQYSHNIPSEYIYPSCIKQLFPFLNKLKVIVTTEYVNNDILLNPNTNEYMNEYIQFCQKQKNILPKLYDCIKEAIYINDYSQIEKSQNTCDYKLQDIVTIQYDISAWNELFDKNEFINMMTTHVFPNVTEIIYNDYNNSFPLSLINNEYFPKLHVINYSATISINDYEYLFPKQLLSIIDTIHLHEINWNIKKEICLFLDDIVSTYSIHISGFDDTICCFPHKVELIKKGLISINIQHKNYLQYSSIKKSVNEPLLNYYEYIVNPKKDIYFFQFKNDYNEKDEHNNNEDQNISNEIKLTLEQLLKNCNNKNLCECRLSFDDTICIKELEWISTHFKNDTFKNINDLIIKLPSHEWDVESKYFSLFETILEKIIPKALNIRLEGNNTGILIESLINKGYFHNALTLLCNTGGILNSSFFSLYTIDNFPRLREMRINPEKYDELLYYNPCDSILQFKHKTNISIDTICIGSFETFHEYEIKALIECIQEHKIQNLKHLSLYVYDDDDLLQIINFIISGQIPKLKEFRYVRDTKRSQDIIDKYIQMFRDSLFIQQNHVYYHFI